MCVFSVWYGEPFIQKEAGVEMVTTLFFSWVLGVATMDNLHSYAGVNVSFDQSQSRVDD